MYDLSEKRSSLMLYINGRVQVLETARDLGNIKMLVLALCLMPIINVKNHIHIQRT